MEKPGRVGDRADFKTLVACSVFVLLADRQPALNDAFRVVRASAGAGHVQEVGRCRRFTFDPVSLDLMRRSLPLPG
jgi:hypothetical protein